jgi:hypothetical protein
VQQRLNPDLIVDQADRLGAGSGNGGCQRRG